MTIMVKTSMGVQKQPADVMVMPLIDIEEPIRPPSRPRKLPPTPSRRAASTLRTMVLISIVVLLITLGSFLVGAILFTDATRKHNAQRNVLFRCGVTSTQDADYVVLKEAPPTASWFGAPLEMKVYSSASDLIGARVLDNLLEDMSIEDDVENIYVHDGPRSFHLVHDFNENYTSIISEERCFLMELIRQFVLEPSSLLASFTPRNESSLELSHAHTVFAAALPPPPGPLPAAARACRADHKPVYRLHLEGTHVLRKRSVEVRTVAPDEEPTAAPSDPTAAPSDPTAAPSDPTAAPSDPTAAPSDPTTAPSDPTAAPSDPTADTGAALPHNDFVQFSGRHLQRITVRNLDAVLRYEQRQPHPKLTAGQSTTL